MPRRELPEINAGSMADIAFLLLVFFLMVTTIDTEKGVLRQLPPPIDKDEVDPPPVRERNVFQVLVNANNDLLVEGDFMRITQLKDAAREFLICDGVFSNIPENENLPVRQWVRKADIQAQLDQMDLLIASTDDDDKKDVLEKAKLIYEKKMLAIEMFGEYKELPGSALISMQNDNNTNYDTYIQVQNELESAVNELRDELCLKHFGITYEELSKSYDRYKNDEEKSLPFKEKLYAVRAVYPQRISEAEPKDLGSY